MGNVAEDFPQHARGRRSGRESAACATDRARCIGEVLHSGGTVAAAQARIVDAENRLYAHATATCAILRPRAAD